MVLWMDIFDEGEENKTSAIFDQSAREFFFHQRGKSGRNVICETPSKFAVTNPPASPDPLLERTGDHVDNGTYFFSDFKLPWLSADGFCRERGGWLADVRTSSENQLLASHLKDRSNSPRYSGILCALVCVVVCLFVSFVLVC